jgi:hypothetical protein
VSSPEWKEAVDSVLLAASTLDLVRGCDFRHTRSFLLLLAASARQTVVAALGHRTFLTPAVDLVGGMVFESCMVPARLVDGTVASRSPEHGLVVVTACDLVGCRRTRNDPQLPAEDLQARHSLHLRLRLFYLLSMAQGWHQLRHTDWAQATSACHVLDLGHLSKRSC